MSAQGRRKKGVSDVCIQQETEDFLITVEVEYLDFQNKSRGAGEKVKQMLKVKDAHVSKLSCWLMSLC